MSGAGKPKASRATTKRKVVQPDPEGSGMSTPLGAHMCIGDPMGPLCTPELRSGKKKKKKRKGQVTLRF